MVSKAKTTKITVFSLAMLITGSIDSVRNLPTTAKFGNELIFFFIFAALFFLIPIALIAAELASTKTEIAGASGVYGWSKQAFGKQVGLLSVWLQWVNTMFWYPTILSFSAGVVAYLINPALADNKWYLLVMINCIFWSLTLMNLRGIKTSAIFATFCTTLGMLLPMAAIILLGMLWLKQGNPIYLHLTKRTVLPNLHHVQSWVSLTAMITSFLGMELAAVHLKRIKHSQTIFPKALFISVIIILFTMIFGSLAIAFVIPQNKIHLVDGIMQAYNYFFTAYNLHWLLPMLGAMILIGSLGSMINWIISPTQGILEAISEQSINMRLVAVNKNGVPANLLFIQAIAVTIICTLIVLMPSINGFYWLLTDLSTELYLFMYIIFFLAAIRTAYKMKQKHIKCKIFRNSNFMIATASLGLLGTLIAIC
ncbi:MAG: APC family permease, partial [Pseudomonadota bacterium]